MKIEQVCNFSYRYILLQYEKEMQVQLTRRCKSRDDRLKQDFSSSHEIHDLSFLIYNVSKASRKTFHNLQRIRRFALCWHRNAGFGTDMDSGKRKSKSSVMDTARSKETLKNSSETWIWGQ
jgi:hypothetical protein